jgi:phospholipase C
MRSSRHRSQQALNVALVAALALVASGLGACAGGASRATPGAAGRSAAAGARRAQQASPITHVVIVVQENRSFDNLFQGYPGANTASSGLNSQGQTIQLQPISFTAPYDIFHSSGAFFPAWDNGKMDGFDKEHVRPKPSQPNPQYGYVPPSETATYFAMANSYVLADNMFASQLDGSFTAHQYLIAGQANHALNFPHGLWGCGPPPGRVRTLTEQRHAGPFESACFDYQTTMRELDQKGLSWHFYGPVAHRGVGHLWIAPVAISYLAGTPEFEQNVIMPEHRFLADVAAGTLSTVTWIIPRLSVSDHAGSRSTKGPAWVASVVNAVGQSRFWDSTVIFVVWDDWGGWYDHVPPPQLDYDGLGFRVPLLCISPYAKSNHVTHILLEHASILRYVEDNFGLAQMSASDARANDAGSDCLDYTQKPRPYSPFSPSLRPGDLEREPSSNPDDE